MEPSSWKPSGTFTSTKHRAKSIAYHLCPGKNTENTKSNPQKIGNVRVKMIMTQPGKDKLLHLMLGSLRGTCTNWLPQCPIKSAPRLSTVAINRS